MRYMGGKFRQSKAIVEVLKPHITPDTVYVEPFCGGLNSAARVAKDLKPKQMILNDANKSLMLMHQKCFREGTEWLPLNISREVFNDYKTRQPEDDPLTAWIGIGYCLTPDWFHSYAPYSAESAKNGHKRCIEWLHNCDNVEFNYGDYRDMTIPDGAVVYLDPPYDPKGGYHNKQFDIPEFWEWARALSKRCTVFVSCFQCPEDFESVYEWGNTVTLKSRATGAQRRRIENEKLVRYIV